MLQFLVNLKNPHIKTGLSDGDAHSAKLHCIDGRYEYTEAMW